MKKWSFALAIGLTVLTLGGCSSSNANKPTKAAVQKQRVEKSADKFKKQSNDKNYYNYVKAVLGKSHVKQLKTTSNKYKAVQLTEGKFTSDSKYNKFGKGIASIIKTVKATPYAKPGIAFIQLDKDKSTQYVFAYNTQSLNKFKFEDLGLNDHGDQAIGKATSYYIEPFFAQDSTSMAMDSKVKVGYTDPHTKEGLNQMIMDSFKN